MLVLSRKVSEKIHIGDDVVLTVIRLGDNRVKIGIEAPNNISIVRSELLPAPEIQCPSKDSSWDIPVQKNSSVAH